MSLRIELVVARSALQLATVLDLPEGAKVLDAMLLAGLYRPDSGPVSGCTDPGIWGRPVALDTVLRDGDRIEFYRPLTADPKQARRQRAAKLKSAAGKTAD
jgi:putative ubiquitin-RnfH superfamily antitoxin RatB of RatAB toxin-antitoxin module